MKTILIIFICLIIGFAIYLFILGIKSQSGNAAGLINDKLSRCPETPNCINSEFVEHSDHYISPLKYSENNKTNISPIVKLKDIILKMGGTIEQQNDNYISATFSSRIFRFVDDLEIRLDNKSNLVHLRSASRVGRGDMGANKKRVERIKQLYEKDINPQQQ